MAPASGRVTPENAHQRALASTIAADEPDHVSGRDSEINAVVGPRRAEDFGHAGEARHGSSSRSLGDGIEERQRTSVHATSGG